MLKLILLIIVVSALGDDGLRPKVYSFHTRFTPGSLNLSTGELKLFSGHAMNIIQSKCPNVNAQKIFQVQKYMGKLLAKNEPVQGKSKEFKVLLDSMITCSKAGIIPRPAKSEFDPSDIQSAGSFPPFFSPFHRLRKVFIQRIPPVVPKQGGVDSGLIEHHSTEQSAVTATPGPLTPPRMISTTIFVRPQDMKEGIKSSGGFFNWIHNLFSRVRGFFKNPFGHRSKRDLSEMSVIPSTAEIAEQIHFPKEELTPAPPKDDSKGKKAFGALIDQMCRIYCDSCSGRKEIRNFKMAAKQLLEDLFEEDSGLEMAATKYLDDDFLNSIETCE